MNVLCVQSKAQNEEEKDEEIHALQVCFYSN